MKQALLSGLAALVLGWPAIAQPNPGPDLSGPWGRDVLYLEPPASGAGPVVNRTKRPNGSMDGSALFGDYSNPILKPAAVEALKKLKPLRAS